MLFILLKSSHHGTEMILFSYAACVGSNEYSLHIKNIFINKITKAARNIHLGELQYTIYNNLQGTISSAIENC